MASRAGHRPAEDAEAARLELRCQMTNSPLSQLGVPSRPPGNMEHGSKERCAGRCSGCLSLGHSED
jgi:hypothetical protein